MGQPDNFHIEEWWADFDLPPPFDGEYQDDMLFDAPNEPLSFISDGRTLLDDDDAPICLAKDTLPALTPLDREFDFLNDSLAPPSQLDEHHILSQSPHHDEAALELPLNPSNATLGERFFHSSFDPVDTDWIPSIQIETPIGVEPAFTNPKERDTSVLISDSDHCLSSQQATSLDMISLAIPGEPSALDDNWHATPSVLELSNKQLEKSLVALERPTLRTQSLVMSNTSYSTAENIQFTGSVKRRYCSLPFHDLTRKDPKKVQRNRTWQQPLWQTWKLEMRCLQKATIKGIYAV